MTLLSSPVPDAVTATAVKHSLAGLYLQLTKARLSGLVLLTTAAGFAVAARETGIDWLRLLWTLLGTGLAAGAANALNQVAEAGLDAMMHRTRQRPLPSGALSAVHGFVFSMLAGFAGLAILGLLVNLLSAGLALVTILIYILLYTPLKRVTTLNTLVGAMCGAIPPMIGWAAAAGRLEPGAWVLAALLFVWQIPHFLALAWMYREDYARANFAMLPVVDASGRITSQVVVVTSLALVPVALSATLFGLAGWIYAMVALALGCWLAGLGARLYVRRSDANARRLFVASITYLPALLAVMVADRGPPGGLLEAPRAVAAYEDAGTASLFPPAPPGTAPTAGVPGPR